RDFFGVSHLAAGYQGFERLLGLFVEQLLLDRGGDLSRTQYVDPDPPVLELAEPDAGVCAQRGLAGRVDAPVGPPLDRGNRYGHEDRAAVVEHRQRLLNGEQGAEGIQAAEPGE